jgi:hypothetical protein
MPYSVIHCKCSTVAVYQQDLEGQMANAKTATLTLRIDPAIKEALRAVAENEHRSIANMIEVLVREYCMRKGVGIPEQQALFSNR